MGDFYAAYVATLGASLDRRTYPSKHAPLEHVRVCVKQVDISLLAIRIFLYGADTDATRPISLPSLTIGGRW